MRVYRYGEISRIPAVSEGAVHAVQGYDVNRGEPAWSVFLMCGRRYMERLERENHGCDAGSRTIAYYQRRCEQNKHQRKGDSTMQYQGRNPVLHTEVG